jgi:hypothetical protein
VARRERRATDRACIMHGNPCPSARGRRVPRGAGAPVSGFGVWPRARADEYSCIYNGAQALEFLVEGGGGSSALRFKRALSPWVGVGGGLLPFGPSHQPNGT